MLNETHKTYMELIYLFKKLNCFKKIEKPIFVQELIQEPIQEPIVKEPKNQIMEIRIQKDGINKTIEVLMENVHLSDFTTSKILQSNAPKPKTILKKVGFLPDTFWDEYKNGLFLINNDNYFTLINKHTELLFENRYTVII